MHSSPVKHSKESKNGGFKVDSEYSAHTNTERDLQVWNDDDRLKFDEVKYNADSKEAGSWDQLADNEKKFGKKLEFKEEYYTTKLSDEVSKKYGSAARVLGSLAEDESTRSSVSKTSERDDGEYSDVVRSRSKREKEYLLDDKCFDDIFDQFNTHPSNIGGCPLFISDSIDSNSWKYDNRRQ